MNEGQQRMEEIFLAALELRDAAPRREFLARACAGSPALRAEVERYLAIHTEAERFFAETNLQLNDTATSPSGNPD